MSRTILTADLGNSRCKLRLWAEGADGSVLRLAATELPSAVPSAPELAAWLSGEDTPARGALSSVAAPEQRERWSRALAPLCAAWNDAPDHGLDNRCRSPESVGLDRLFAARGALEYTEGSALVIDCGTAATVDAVRRTGRGRAQFLGGAIAPGPALLARALSRGTAQLPEVVPQPGVPALGVDTHSALLSGIAIGFAGAVRELARRIAQEAGLEHAPWVLTGGARAFLGPALECERIIEVPDLVHIGLRAALVGASAGRDEGRG